MILTALVGGLGPGLVVSALSTVAALYFFMAPAGSLVAAVDEPAHGAERAGAVEASAEAR